MLELHDGAELADLQLRDAGRRIWICFTHLLAVIFLQRAGARGAGLVLP